ncbi:oxidoreductase [Aspergillus vadensis CBS 113365]|uniref:Oxidoreductase n=1 Tax=Aspergillus vadensis (strain CBS 113365 / IMI 142717 / IBT 24658) TaxID=1448311 RepID=A0A319B534_ASPVC|nr:oxidoreductase [Aspergillus vadensis CBS 113365]PYH66904.1 oxidoreductase [Aspergillus vadensis CBS 113365]
MTTPSLISINKLADTRVLLIGGTSGIGFTVARAALEHGASIIIFSSNPQTLYPNKVYTDRITGKPCDLGDQATLEKNLLDVLDYATSRSLFPNTAFPTRNNDCTKRVLLNHIIYTAGTPPPRIPISSPEINASTFATLSTLRLHVPMVLGKHAKSYLVDNYTSSITFTSGLMAARPAAGLAVGGAAVGSALEGLTSGLAVELAPIRVNVVAPGAVETEILERLGPAREAYLEAFKKGTLTGEVGRPEDVAEAYVWCMKDGFVTGQRVGSDGGALLKGA